MAKLILEVSCDGDDPSEREWLEIGKPHDEFVTELAAAHPYSAPGDIQGRADTRYLEQFRRPNVAPWLWNAIMNNGIDVAGGAVTITHKVYTDEQWAGFEKRWAEEEAAELIEDEGDGDAD